MGRREILGLEGRENAGGWQPGAARPAAGDDESQEKASDAMDIPELDGEGSSARGPSFGAVHEASTTATTAVTSGGARSRPAAVMNDTARRFYRGAVPLAVFRAAVKHIPDDVQFRAGFLRCSTLDFPSIGSEVAEAVLASIAEDFPESCEAWEMRASYPLLVGGGSGSGMQRNHGEKVTLVGPVVQECIDFFEQAVDAVGIREPDMWVRYALFLQARMEDAGREERMGGSCSDLGMGVSCSAAVVAELARRLRDMLSRAVAVHLTKTEDDAEPAPVINVREDAAARGRQLASGKTDTAADLAERRAEAREAIGVGLSDVCLALGRSEEALSALRAVTDCLPQRPGPWLRLAALVRRLNALGVAGRGDRGTSTEPGADGTVGARNNKDIGSRVDQSIATLRAGLKAVPTTSPGYPSLWRELLASLVAGGAGKKKVASAFRTAVEMCAPAAGRDPGDAQGEFLTGYVRWCGSVEGAEAAFVALQWARRSFLLAGTGAAAAYLAVVELERTLGDVGSGGGTSEGDATKRDKRVRELFEVGLAFVCSPLAVVDAKGLQRTCNHIEFNIFCDANVFHGLFWCAFESFLLMACY